MNNRIKLLICTALVSAYEITTLVLRSNYEVIHGYEILGAILCIIGLLSFIFIGKAKRCYAVIPLAIFVIGIIVRLDFTNLISLAKLYEMQKANAGVFYIGNFICHYFLLPLTYIAIIINILLNNKIRYYVFIALTIIMISTIATSFYHIGIDSSDIALVGFKAVCYYAPLYVYMRICNVNYDELTPKFLNLKKETL